MVKSGQKVAFFYRNGSDLTSYKTIKTHQQLMEHQSRPISMITWAYIALGVLCIVWGTTYTAIKYAIRDFPPYLLVGLRQTTAGLIILGLALLTGKLGRVASTQNNTQVIDNESVGTTSLLTTRYVALQALTGLATITGGNGFITWGMQQVSTSVAAVIGSLTPVVVLLINLLWHRKGERISSMTIAGVLLGFAGLGFLFHEGWADFSNPLYRWGIVGCFASCFTWSLGTVMAKRFNAPEVSPLVNAGIQITAGGLGGFILSGLFDTSHVIHHTWAGWGSVAYLTLIGSALAFTMYMFVLKHLSATAASLYTYINPVVAVLLGWLCFSEPLTAGKLAGLSITLMGVWLVNRGERG
jgi:drug/metabolite transporter (DMT)-like permease